MSSCMKYECRAYLHAMLLNVHACGLCSIQWIILQLFQHIRMNAQTQRQNKNMLCLRLTTEIFRFALVIVSCWDPAQRTHNKWSNQFSRWIKDDSFLWATFRIANATHKNLSLFIFLHFHFNWIFSSFRALSNCHTLLRSHQSSICSCRMWHLDNTSCYRFEVCDPRTSARSTMLMAY